eukprot:TRINITY_DN18567_c0_g1_i1.p1 TRINITY_DN18567_c0_g1~~TRINITY_DN18567_c0_g1_i1.p1  ORF type:complete len:586 (+),score=127.50 TRINITY_DN18567_c0_g1_i1:85-1842(+)
MSGGGKKSGSDLKLPVAAYGGCTQVGGLTLDSPADREGEVLLVPLSPTTLKGPTGNGASPTTAPAASNYYKGSFDSAHKGAIHCEGFTTRQELTSTIRSRGLVIVLVGLPGRGKSFISRKSENFFQWQCMKTKSFNVGKYRRAVQSCGTGNADYFDPSNRAAAAERLKAAVAALEDLLAFLDAGGEVAIYDATNSTNERRQMIMDTVQKHVEEKGCKYRVVFVECLCTDEKVLYTNMKNKVEASPDFAGMSFEKAMADLQERVKNYEQKYETIEDDTLSYIKLYNMSSKVMVNKIYGSYARSLMPFLMGVHIGSRPIWLVRSGQVCMGKKQDANLTAEGIDFAASLGKFVRRRMLELKKDDARMKGVNVFSSTVTGATQTVLEAVHHISDVATLSIKKTPALNPIDRGRIDGSWWVDMSTEKPPWEELERKDTQFFSKWKQNKLKTRFPGGESYFDCMTRSEGCLLDMEMSTKPVLCVSHITLIQVLCSYFQNLPLKDAWDLSVPPHTVIEVIPSLGGGFQVDYIPVNAADGSPDSNITPKMLRRRSGPVDLFPDKSSPVMSFQRQSSAPTEPLLMRASSNSRLP